MTREKIIELAKKANIAKHGLGWTCWEGQLERFAELVQNEAFEQAAQACFPARYPHEADRHIAHKCAAAIRELKK